MDEKTKYMAPTIVKDVLPDDALMSECVWFIRRPMPI
jgi:hypothetical protein